MICRHFLASFPGFSPAESLANLMITQTNFNTLRDLLNYITDQWFCDKLYIQANGGSCLLIYPSTKVLHIKLKEGGTTEIKGK